MIVLGRVQSYFRRKSSERISGLGLSLFRIAIGCVTLYEVAHLYFFRELIFDPFPDLGTIDNRFGPFLLAWIVAVVCITLGVFVRGAAVVNFVCNLLTFSTFTDFEYHWDYPATTIAVLLPFMPLTTHLSLERVLRRRLGLGSAEGSGETAAVSPLFYLLPMAAAIGILYFDSVLWKAMSPMWRRGLGVWLPASIPPIALVDLSWLLERRLAVKLLSFLTLFLEFSFLFLLWFRRGRLVLLGVGLGLHVGILLAFPIPGFALGMLALYVLVVPVSWLEWLRVRLGGSPAPASGGSGGVREPGRRLRLVALAALVVMTFVGQGVHIFLGNPAAWSTWRSVGLLRTSQAVRGGLDGFNRLSRVFLGAFPHAVFVDSHFDRYTRTFAVIYEDASGERKWLPIMRESGRPDYYNVGRNWAYWTFRCQGGDLNEPRFSYCLRRWVGFWARKNGVPLTNVSFDVLVKEVRPPVVWESGVLRTEMARPWTKVGQIHWRNNQFGAALDWGVVENPPGSATAARPAPAGAEVRGR